MALNLPPQRQWLLTVFPIVEFLTPSTLERDMKVDVLFIEGY